MLRRLLLPLALLGTALVGASAGNAKGSFDLKGEVYPNSMFKIEMTNAAGKKLTTIKAGTYRIKVEDKATVHDFHLVGPGVNKSTSVAGTGDQMWTVKLTPGTYTFKCDPHASTMKGSFKVTP
jgi:plastocyanin